MEGAGKLIDDDELREAMAEKGLGTPATRAATIEGLIAEKYMLREGRELIPHGQGLPADDAVARTGGRGPDQAELTGDWEYQLAQMEKGKLNASSSWPRSPP